MVLLNIGQMSEQEIMQGWLSKFNSALLLDDNFESAISCFETRTDIFWRDLLSFSWNIVTFEGSQAIKEAFQNTIPFNKPIEG
eukprot:Pgem_evm1s17409